VCRGFAGGSLEEHASVEISSALLAACQVEAKKCVLLAQKAQGEGDNPGLTNPQTYQVLQGMPSPIPTPLWPNAPGLASLSGRSRHAGIAGQHSGCVLGPLESIYMHIYIYMHTYIRIYIHIYIQFILIFIFIHTFI